MKLSDWLDEKEVDIHSSKMKWNVSVTGFNIGINIGESADQTIFHTHIHLIPGRDGDTVNSRGGVRGVIPDKRSYYVYEP